MTPARDDDAVHDGMPWLSVLATVALFAAVTFGVIACGSSGPKTGPSGGNAACRNGAAVGSSTRGGLPSCAAAEPPDSVFAYACRAAGKGEFFIVYRGTARLYGKPGGRWATAAKGATFDSLRVHLSC